MQTWVEGYWEMSSEPQQDRKPDNKKLLTVEQCENWKARVHQEKVAAKEGQQINFFI